MPPGGRTHPVTANTRKNPRHLQTACEGLYIINRTFANNQQAQRFLKLLQTPSAAAWIDADMVQSGDHFYLSVNSFADEICLSLPNKKVHLKIFRSALDVSGQAHSAIRLKVDPYYLGLWLGDGSVKKPRITSTEPEIKRYLGAFVDQLTESTGVRHHLRVELAGTAGSVSKDGIKRTKDAFNYYITTRKGSRDVNKISEGLDNLGLFSQKNLGIPDEYLRASEEDKFKLLAGLIDADGHLCDRNNRYELTQYGDEHKEIVSKAKNLAQSV